MDFSLIDHSSIYNQKETCSGRIPFHFTAAATAPFRNTYSITPPTPNSSSPSYHNMQEQRFSLFPQNMGNPNSIAINPCTSLSLQNSNRDSTEAMRETIFHMAMMQPVDVEPAEPLKPSRRRNVRISKDPQSVAARHRRERISQRIRTLQRMVPGGAKLDTASMLEEAVHYLKFLKKQLHSLEQVAARSDGAAMQMRGRLFPAAVSAMQMLC